MKVLKVKLVKVLAMVLLLVSISLVMTEISKAEITAEDVDKFMNTHWVLWQELKLNDFTKWYRIEIYPSPNECQTALNIHTQQAYETQTTLCKKWVLEEQTFKHCDVHLQQEGYIIRSVTSKEDRVVISRVRYKCFPASLTPIPQ